MKRKVYTRQKSGETCSGLATGRQNKEFSRTAEGGINLCVREKIETGFVAASKDRKWQVAKARQEKHDPCYGKITVLCQKGL